MKKKLGSGIIGFLLFFISLSAVGQNSLTSYMGNYKRNVNGYNARLSIYIKNNKLTVRQLWDGKIKTLEYLTRDKFIVAMEGWSVKFIRDRNNKVIQMQVLASDLWIKI